MKLTYDNVTRTTKNQDGVDIRIPGWGDQIAPFLLYVQRMNNLIILNNFANS